MRFVALLPQHSAQYLQGILLSAPTAYPTSCAGLREILHSEVFDAVLIDPEVGGDNTDAMVGMIRSHPRTRFIAYVQRTAASLRAVFRLSQQGLEDVFVHPVKASDPRFLNVIGKIEADNLASDVLATVERKTQRLAPSVMEVLLDVFRRPYRYVSATDLADEAGVSVRCLYRLLESADFCSARKLITMAKVIHGFSYLRTSRTTVSRVSTKLRYTSPDGFSKHVLEHLGIHPTDICAKISSEHAVLHLIEALNKPRALQRQSRGWPPKRVIHKQGA